MEDLSQYPLELKGPNIPMVSFMNVSKGYGSLTVLENLNLNIDKGEMVSIIGPSGSGKTTVLRMLMLEKIDKGVIYLDGKPITHMEKDGLLIPATDKYLLNARTQIGMCFQHFNLFPHMTALQNCMEGLVQVLGMSKNDAKNRSEELLEMVGVIDKKDQHPSRLSGGQQQRVAIARAVVAGPKLILADEPTGNLDSTHGEEVMNLLTHLNEAGTTIVMVTHSPADAEYSHRVIHLFDGHVVTENVIEKKYLHADALGA